MLIVPRSLGIFVGNASVSLSSVGLLVGLDIVACMLMMMEMHIDMIKVIVFILNLKKGVKI